MRFWGRWGKLFLGVVFLGGIGGFFQVVHAQSSIDPEQIEVRLAPGECTQQTVTVTMGTAPIPSLDVVLVIDVTSSMQWIIDSVTDNAGQIVEDIRMLVPDSNFALATLSDYPGSGGLLSLLTGFGDAGDYPWRLEQAFTSDERLIQAGLDNIQLMSGGDDAESYLRALYETRALNWRHGSRRIVLFFGDSYPHDPDPGPDGALETADDLTQEAVIQQLKDSDITVLAIYTANDSSRFYEQVATATDGQAFRLDHAEQVPGAIQELVEGTVSRIQALTLRPEGGSAGWLRWDPEIQRGVVPLEQRSFAVELCVPTGTEGGDYPVDLAVMGDGALLGQIPVLVRVPVSPEVLAGAPGFDWRWGLAVLPAGLMVWGGLRLLSRRPTAPRGIAAPGLRSGGGGAPRSKAAPRSPSGGAEISHGRPHLPIRRKGE